MRRGLIGVLALAYLGVMAFFAFRPFKPIAGVQYPSADLEWVDQGILLQRGAALKVTDGVDEAREAWLRSGRLSIEILLSPDRLDLAGSPLIILFGRTGFNQNFSLSQDGNSIEFTLRTQNSRYGLFPSLIVPKVLDAGRLQHLCITYDGAETCFYVDGQLHTRTDRIRGGFGNWGEDHSLILGDEPPGGDAWFGSVQKVSMYNRALVPDEVDRLFKGGEPRDPLMNFDFRDTNKVLPEGVRKLHYRNVFMVSDSAAYDMSDCIFNIIGFVPLGAFAYMVLPLRMERRKILAAVLIPLLTGLAVSGMIEWLQGYVSMRVPCAPDLVYNGTGALLGGLLAWLAFSTFKNRESDRSNI